MPQGLSNDRLKYFTLRESHNERRHIATIVVDLNYPITSGQEFNRKITEALTEHFDEPCTLVKRLDPQFYIANDPHDESFEFTYDGDAEAHTDQFEIEQTWLY